MGVETEATRTINIQLPEAVMGYKDGDLPQESVGVRGEGQNRNAIASGQSRPYDISWETKAITMRPDAIALRF
jgi:hypothetical protein